MRALKARGKHTKKRERPRWTSSYKRNKNNGQVEGEVINKIKIGKASGHDNVNTEMCKNMNEERQRISCNHNSSKTEKT